MTQTIALLYEQLSPEQGKAVNQICDRFEKGWQKETSNINDSLQVVEDAIKPVILHELVLIDILYRCPKPSKATIADYAQRYPELDVGWLSQQLGTRTLLSGFDSTLPQSDAWSDVSTKSNEFADRIGKFLLVRQIGSGGMGVVYEAKQTDLNRTVALKTLTTLVARNTEARSRFRAEVEAVARLHHPHIVQIYEVGLENGTPFYSMEYVEGGNLAELNRLRPLAPRTAAKLIAYVSKAIHYAHTCGVIHRDLKPGNILLAKSKHGEGVELPVGQNTQSLLAFFEPKIADFGLAKRMDSESQQTLQAERWMLRARDYLSRNSSPASNVRETWASRIEIARLLRKAEQACSRGL